MAKKTPKPAARRKRGAEDHILGERQNIIDTAERDFFASTGLSPFVTWKKGEMEAALRGEITEFDDPRKAGIIAEMKANRARKAGK